MKLLDATVLEELTRSGTLEGPNIPETYDCINLQSFTHIATDAKTLSALAKYTQKAVRESGCILDLSALEEISPAVLLVFLRGERIDYIHFAALRRLDLGSARMLVSAIHKGVSWINFGIGFELSNLGPDVLAELFTSPRYGWTEDGEFHLFGEQAFLDYEKDGHLA